MPHPKSTVDPARDLADLEAEILLNDMAIVETRLERIVQAEAHRARPPSSSARKRCSRAARRRSTARRRCASSTFDKDEERVLRGFQLLSRKPAARRLQRRLGPGVRAARGPHGRDHRRAAVRRRARGRAAAPRPTARNSARPTASPRTGMDLLVRSAYRLLGLISFLTAGEDEVRAWTIQDGDSAVDAAGAIHSDLAQGFVRAQCAVVRAVPRGGIGVEGAGEGVAADRGPGLPGGRRRHPAHPPQQIVLSRPAFRWPGLCLPSRGKEVIQCTVRIPAAPRIAEVAAASRGSLVAGAVS